MTGFLVGLAAFAFILAVMAHVRIDAIEKAEKERKPQS